MFCVGEIENDLEQYFVFRVCHDKQLNMKESL